MNISIFSRGRHGHSCCHEHLGSWMSVFSVAELFVPLALAALLVPLRGAAQHGADMGMTGSGVALTFLKPGGDHTDCFNARLTGELFRGKKWSVAAVARYQYINVDMASDCLRGTVYTPQQLGLDGGHDVYQFGLNSFVRTHLWGKPFLSFAMLRSDFSSGGFERINAMAAGLFMLKTTRTTQFGIGPMVLLNMSSRWPLFPIFIYRRQFSGKLALSLYGAIFGLDYTPTRRDFLSAGFDVDARSFYFRPGVAGLPEVCRYTKTLFRPMAKYRRTLTKHLSAEIEAGVELNMSSRVYSRTGTRHYFEVHSPASPFVQVTANYRL